MIKEIFLTILLILCLYAIRRLTVSYKPKVIVNPNGKMQKIINRMKMINTSYKPTPWLLNCHIHTIWGMKFRGKTNIKPRREAVNFEDGGEVYVDWFETPSTQKTAPILVIVHTLGGGTREPCTNRMAVYAMRHGWRALVASCRGCNGSRLTTKRLYDGVRTDDLHTIINFAKKEFPESTNQFILGFSLGSMISIQYGVDYDDVDAVLCVSHPLDPTECLNNLERPLQNRLYNPAIMHALKRVIAKTDFYTGEQREKALKSRNMFEFDDVITAKNLGLNSYKEYYAMLELGPKCLQTKVPVIVFNSLDDPFTDPKLIPTDAIKKSDKAAFVGTPEGGHVSFCEGMDGRSSYLERFAIDYFETVLKEKKEGNTL